MEPEKKNYSGLSSEEAGKRIQSYGFNEISVDKQTFFVKILKLIISPITLMLIAAAILSAAIGKLDDFYIIIILIVINLGITIIQEKKADSAVEKLKNKLIVKINVFRDKAWQEIESRNIVVGDVIELKIGTMVPADLKVIESSNLSLNEAMITGESMPSDKNIGDKVFSGSFVSTGRGIGEVVAIGKNTEFGKTITLLETKHKPSTMEKEILNISKFLSILSLTGVVILSLFFIFKHKVNMELLILDLSLIIAGVPIDLPTVMTLITTFGILELSKKDVIIRRLSSLEDFANVDLLLTDKTGTLTKNEINVTYVFSQKPNTDNDVLTYATIAAKEDETNVLNKAVIDKANNSKISIKNYKVLNFIPADSKRKRSTVVIESEKITKLICVGAVQIIEPLCSLTGAEKKNLDYEIEKAANQGYRIIAVAVKSGNSESKLEEKNMLFLGLVALSDTPQDGAKEEIEFLHNQGISVKMITGDNHSISKRIAGELKIDGDMMTGKEFESAKNKSACLNNTAVFTEVLPEDKYNIVVEAKKTHMVAVTGDGVNDLPALKTANVGIAVSGSVDAVKSSTDIVLLSKGLSVIKDAVIESRKIFARIYTYSIYRISESFRVIWGIVILGIMYGFFPLTPIQLILLAMLNDLPIISLAFNKVKLGVKPAKENPRKKILTGTIFGLTGVLNSILFVILLKEFFKFDWNTIQTLFFLKLIVSGHMLIFVAHTHERWFKNLPSKPVIIATISTQIVGTIFVVSGFLMTKVSIWFALGTWLWAFFWMQISDFSKRFNKSSD